MTFGGAPIVGPLGGPGRGNLMQNEIEIEIKSQYWPRGAPKHVETAENEA